MRRVTRIEQKKKKNGTDYYYVIKEREKEKSNYRREGLEIESLNVLSYDCHFHLDDKKKTRADQYTFTVE